MIPCTINGKESIILGNENISNQQIQDYLKRMNEYYETTLYEFCEADVINGNIELTFKKNEKPIRIFPISKENTKYPIKNKNSFGLVVYNSTKPKSKILKEECDYATS